LGSGIAGCGGVGVSSSAGVWVFVVGLSSGRGFFRGRGAVFLGGPGGGVVKGRRWYFTVSLLAGGALGRGGRRFIDQRLGI
jgi:hypothetical protein